MPPSPRMRATHVFEAALYASDLDAMAEFYARVFGLDVISRFGTRGLALRCGRTAVLVFDPARTCRDDEMVPKHGASGAGHLAFLTMTDDLPRWRDHLATCGVPIEREVTWPAGGTSVYVRDPAGNSVELAPPTLWGGLGFRQQAGEPRSSAPPAALERNKQVVRAFVDIVNRQDWPALADVVDARFVRHSDAAGEPGVRSRGDLEAFLREEYVAFPDAREVVEDLVAEGDRVAARHAFTGTQLGSMGPYPPTGKPMRARYLAIYRVEDGRLTEAWVEWDNLTGLAQLGHWTA